MERVLWRYWHWHVFLFHELRGDPDRRSSHVCDVLYHVGPVLSPHVFDVFPRRVA